jgi:hypothetical protein
MRNTDENNINFAKQNKLTANNVGKNCSNYIKEKNAK